MKAQVYSSLLLVSLRREMFAIREMKKLTLPAGVYEARLHTRMCMGGLLIKATAQMPQPTDSESINGETE